jgi:ABC-2 type transport system ATP-binding protein
MNKTIIQVKNLHKKYGDFEAVKGISFDVMEGEIFGLLGPNGAGKTSTLSAIEGLLSWQEGEITVGGFNSHQFPRYARASLGVQLQSTNFQPELTVREILRLYAGIHGLNLSGEDITRLLREIKLEDAAKKRFGQLSGGQQQRVSLVIATLHDPKLVLLDEPTTGLDPQSRRQLWERMEAIRANHRSILLTTHSMEEAEAVCDRIAIIDHGCIIATGAPEALVMLHRNDPEVIAVSRKGKITLEDVFIGLTGKTIRNK